MTEALPARPTGLLPRVAWTREPAPGWTVPALPAAPARGAHRGRRRRWSAGLAGLLAVLCAVGVTGGADAPVPAPAAVVAPAADPCGPTWVRAWQASVQPGGAELSGATLRMVVHPQVTGDEVRVRLSNRFGAGPLVIGNVAAGRSDGSAGVLPGSTRDVPFGGARGVTIPPGGEVTSDPVPLDVTAGRPVAVSLHVVGAPGVVATHPVALQTSYVVPGRDVTAAPTVAALAEETGSWFVLTGLDVWTARPVSAVVAVGDSITDGVGAPVGAEQRWPDALAGRLSGAGGSTEMAVLNAGLAGNRLLAPDPAADVDSPLARFADDVAAAAGVTDVVLNIGTNDLAAGRSAAEVIAGLQAFADRARAAGKRVLLSTITPSTTGPHGTRAAIAAREEINEWVRTEGLAHADGIVDFAAAVADPADPRRLAPTYDAGDGLHLSAAGYRAMAAALDPALLSGSPCRADRTSAVVAAG
ncbi:Lysophospholipase L1 [Pseudonocardia thermophila]|uniref:Lysophospholipase L1 n=1 Tax=Pseudonocardia thermophila TaxID=1848 RepID=A0A1M6YM31_PSETH|nr:GDSL-type esterase/lipase family protein [Pseudonocardia thermophila]SHL19170.1 Lysophospholipase L1 [Pseudonocardia thermophila]